ncbi:hypothetical protein BCL76_12333 [Streptomyces sp. CG 926]|uniref:hypothetical protein n=1 Tax=Streptomyces sp. CG 926 TaxID=1882405 RepID=UPI000D6B9D10|nr:hypothetical protein [Streptomyces sp. CG 926]PWK63089.1 hypothetical protein BCL76_12333 [Streptomyces sp. CG 926]
MPCVGLELVEVGFGFVDMRREVGFFLAAQLLLVPVEFRFGEPAAGGLVAPAPFLGEFGVRPGARRGTPGSQVS